MNAKLDGLFWLMAILGGAVYVAVMALGAVALFTRRGRVKDTAFIVGGGIVVPALVLTVLAIATVRTTNAVTAPARQPLHIDVLGYQYWWQVAYPDHDAVTANEVHIPVGRDVELVLESADVIHSFWVPDLAGKVDLVPGQANTLKLRADKAGVYRGVCAEFCGLQHTKMGLLVIAEPGADFDAWVRRQAEPAATGNETFEASTCAGCHTVRGTTARGCAATTGAEARPSAPTRGTPAKNVAGGCNNNDGGGGPDLTHFGSRRTLGAVAADNTPENLRRWILDAQELKPGSNMPPVELSDQELDAIVAYLESLQ